MFWLTWSHMRNLIQSVRMWTRREKKKSDPTSWFSVKLSVPFFTFNTVIVGTPQGLCISSRSTAPPLTASTEQQKPDSPTCKGSICSTTQHNNKKLHNQIRRQPNLNCNTLWQFVFDTGVSAWCFAGFFSADSIVCRMNAFDGAEIFFLSFRITFFLCVFFFVHYFSKWRSALYRRTQRDGEERGWVWVLVWF